MKKVLVTGFEPFDNDSVNPSMEFCHWLKKQDFSFPLHVVVLPVSFTSSFPQVKNAILSFAPTHVLMTGFAKNRKEITIERIGINWVDARIPDNDGLIIKSQKILENGDDEILTSLPIDYFIEKSGRFFPTKSSSSAGEYVCNHLLYLYLNEFKHIPGTFVHLPGADHYEDIFNGILNVISSL